LASKLHLAGLLLLLCGLTAAGVLAQHQATATNASAGQLADHSKAIPFYVSALVIDWALFCYCYIGVRSNGGTLATLSGGRWKRPKEILIDITIAALFWVIWEGTAYGTHFLLDRLFPRTKVAAVDSLLPRSWNEVALWIIVCASAGVCEEVVYRGYLQKQFLALTKSVAVAIVLQGVVFGVSHGYQGWKNVTVISILGVLYGVLAAWRGNLRANIISHAWSDTWEGWLQFLFFK
jgi:hypothetical protein